MITWSGHLSMLFAALPDPERPAAAYAAGFRTVESWWPEDDRYCDAWAAEIERLGLDVALLNFPAGDIRAGARGSLNRPERADAVRADFERGIALAGRVGAQRMNLLVGIELPDVPRERQMRQAAGLVAEAARMARPHGIGIAIEPLNPVDVPGYLICDVPSALELLELAGEPGGVMYDAYHAARSGRDPIAEVARYAGSIVHVQYADHPGRGIPGSGSLDLAALAGALEAAGYEGAVGLELDRGDTDVAELVARLPRPL